VATLYLSEQGTTLRKDHNRFVIERDGREVASIHEFKIERVVVFGNVQLTTSAMTFLMNSGIDTAFVSLYGKLKGRLAPIESKNVFLRTAQYDRSRDAAWTLRMARSFVEGKLRNGLEILNRQKRNHPELDVAKTETSVRSMLTRLNAAPTLDHVRGVEGHAAAQYYRSFGAMFRGGLRFEHRSRRPPKDPINSLLSFGYTLLYNEAVAAVTACGFDPYIGYLHALDYGRCSLALDLIEEFRALVVDRLTLNLANLNVIGPGDFQENESGGLLLDDAPRKRFLSEYERLMTSEFKPDRGGEAMSLRKAIFGQAEALRRCVLENAPYVSFRGWR
jgi:CRISPR-associated protein Cas1